MVCMTPLKSLIASLCFAVVSTVNASGDNQPKAISDFVSVGVGYGNLPTPEVLEAIDVERWARMLQASDEQRAFMLSQYAQFVSRHNEFLDEEAPRLLEKAAEFGKTQLVDLPSAEVAKAANNLAQATSRMHSELEQLENEFIDSFVDTLTDDQVDRVYLLRNEASRRQCRSFWHYGRWTKVDLRLVWEATPKDGFSAEDQQQLEVILDDYETRITPLLRRMARVHWAGVTEMSILIAKQREGGIDDATFRNRYLSIWNRFGDSVQRIGVVTEQTVRSAQDSLPINIGARFVAEAKAAAFPELYPDANALDGLFRNLTTDAELSTKIKEASNALWVYYQPEYAAVCKEAEDFCIHWGNMTSRGTDGYQTQFFAEAFKPLLEKRNAVCERWRAEVVRAVGKKVVASNTPEAESTARTPSQLRATSAGVRPPKRPPTRRPSP